MMNMTAYKSAMAVYWLFAALLSSVVSGFVPQTHQSGSLAFVSNQNVAHDAFNSRLFSEALTESGFENKQPSSMEARSMGVLDWPQQTKMGAWTERLDVGRVAARYVLEGGGMVVVTLFENDGYTPKVDLPEEYRVVPGCLVEAMGPCKLEWQTDEDAEMVILTPGYEEGSTLALVGIAFVVLCGALIAGVGQ